MAVTFPGASLGANTFTGTQTIIGDLLFTDGLYDIGKSGATRPRDGFFSRNLDASAGTVSGLSLQAGAAGQIYFSGRAVVASGADGVITLTNNAGTGFTRINLGGTTSAFPSLARSSTTIYARLADDSGAASLRAQAIVIDGNATIITSAASMANGAGASAGTITNAPSIGNPTKWIGINDNGTVRYVPAW